MRAHLAVLPSQVASQRPFSVGVPGTCWQVSSSSSTPDGNLEQHLKIAFVHRKGCFSRPSASAPSESRNRFSPMPALVAAASNHSICSWYCASEERCVQAYPALGCLLQQSPAAVISQCSSSRAHLQRCSHCRGQLVPPRQLLQGAAAGAAAVTAVLRAFVFALFDAVPVLRTLPVAPSRHANHFSW